MQDSAGDFLWNRAQKGYVSNQELKHGKQKLFEGDRKCAADWQKFRYIDRKQSDGERNYFFQNKKQVIENEK